ncbi:MAG: hypothetical protein DWQ47_08485 [Acidobacteria bacterium]|nr:MAG: hypothetical protein DWQ32_16585 [Acidobacteriota bacterium]REJ99054.1 MAG: hypothetical protein DWQ38_13395 [Acidobacteriota bacterium]REK16225.1 MAG: hypothetical protein DWQ43_04295 [Acidobacteriota bacterium]REK43906.1 MAG: hypothetical protein DWQ47_08485 [Acidobacteriota bacterium]
MKRLFLFSLIASVALCAVIGIAVIILGNFGELEQKILLTTFTVTCMSILGLACGPAYETERGRIVATPGIVLAVTAGAAWMFLIWVNSMPESQLIPKGIMTATLLAIVFAHLSLVVLAKLEKRFLWAQYLLYVCVAALTGLLLSLIWFTDTFESDVTFRALGVLSILVAALTISVPVLHKLSDTQTDEAKIDDEIERLRARIAELEARKQ